MAINAFQAGVNTVSATNINLDPLTLTDGDIIIWDSEGNYFVNARPIEIKADLNIPDDLGGFTNGPGFVTQASLTAQLANVQSGGSIDLTTYATQAFVTQQINNINLFDGDYNSLTNLPTIINFSGDYNDLSNKPNLFSGDYDDLINKPTIFSGNYNDLTNQPSIPSIAGLATETFVNTQISNIIDSDSQTLSLSGQDLTISGGNTIDVSTLQQTLSLSGTTLTISGTNGNVVDLSSFSGISSSSVGDLADVDITTITVNQVLKWDGTKLVPHSLDASDLQDNTGRFFDGDYNSLTNRPNFPNDLLDLNITDGTAGQVLKTDGLGGFSFQDETGGSGGGGGIELTDLSVQTQGASGAGQLSYSAANGRFTFRPADLTNYIQQSQLNIQLGNYVSQNSLNTQLGSYTTTADLPSAIDTHLNQTNPTTGYVLSWNGSDYAWVAQTGGGGGGGGSMNDLIDDTTPQLGGDLDGQAFNITTTGKILYSNMYAQVADLPNANTYHGMFAHVHATGKGYFAHGGNWVELLDENSNLSDLANVSVNAPTAGQVLKWDGTQWAPAADSTGGGGAGIALTDLSVGADATASGSGGIAYNDVTGVFTYTPPVLFDGVFGSLTGTPTTIAGYGITDAFDGDYTNLTNAPTIPSALTDLGITDGTNGQVLQTDGNGSFTFTNPSGGGATTLGALTDVSNTTPSDGQVLKYDATNSIWAPAADQQGSGGGGGIALTDLSVSTASNFGQGNFTYNNSTGVFIYTPPDLSSYSTFSGNYADLQGLPSLFSGSYTDLTNTPATSDNLELSLTGTTTLNLVNGDDNTVIDSVNLNTITGGLSYNDLDDLPTLFSGSYTDLTNTPAIPSLAGYATQTYVQNFVAGITSDNVTEGSVNLYFNDERVDDRVAALINAGVGITSTYNDAGNLLTLDIGQPVGTTDNVTFNDVIINGTLTSDDITSTSVTVSGDATITGNLTVQGTTTSLNSTTLDVDDINITVAKGAANAAAANLAGLTVDGANATFTYTSADDRWNLNKDLNVTNVYADLTGDVTGDVTGNADTATALQTGRTFTIGGDTTAPAVSFDGTSNILLTTTLANSGVTAGTYGSGTEIPSIIVDAKGRITSASVVAVSSDLPIAGDSGTDTVSLLTDTLTLAGVTGLTSTVTNNTVTFDLDDTAVTAGNYGSGTEIPVVTIDDQGRITAASVATVSSDLPLAGDTGTDTVSLLTDTLTIAGGTGIETDVASDTATVTLSDTAVTPGQYGTNTAIPVIDIDQQGRITGATTTTISTDLPVAGDTGTDTISLLTDTLTFTGGVGVDTSIATDTLTIDIGQAVGTTDDVEFAKVTATEESHIKIVTSNSVTVTQKDLVLAGQTTDATATEIFLNDGSSTVDIASGVTAKFKATIVATDGTDNVALTKTGLIQNVSGTTSLIGTVITETFAEDSGNNWDIDVTADDPNDKLKVEVTGEVSKTIDWTVFLEISEVKR